MKKILYVLLTLFICNYSLAAGSDDSESSKVSMYDEAVKLIKRAGKLEKKDKNEKAAKLYQQAFHHLSITCFHHFFHHCLDFFITFG